MPSFPGAPLCLRRIADGTMGMNPRTRSPMPRPFLPRALLPLLLLLPMACGDQPDPEFEGVLALQGASVYTAADAPPIDDGVVVIIDGVIEGVGPRGQVQIPPAARRINLAGLTIVPGFWNVDVRIPPELLELAESADDDELRQALEERFTRFGFVTVVETATPSADLELLRARIRDGVPGPRILTGLPAGDDLGWVPSLTRASWPAPDESPEEADRRMQAALDEVASHVAMGGVVLFGTGAGYVPEYDPSMEMMLLEEVGVPLLESLTLLPAIQLGHDYTGLIEPGMVADLVVIEGDPVADPSSLTRVRWVLKEGITQFDLLRR